MSVTPLNRDEEIVDSNRFRFVYSCELDDVEFRIKM